jgi:hypothetical protein
MTLELFLQAVFQVTTATIFILVCIAGVVVSANYLWKFTMGIIKGKNKFVKKMKKHSLFKEDKPVISMVKQQRAKS